VVHFASFLANAAAWQNFYLLVGTAAATLVGLMFVAVTFGSSVVTPESLVYARSFLDPTYAHFVQVLVTACLLTIPTMNAPLLGAALIFISVFRGARLFQIYAHMRQAQRLHNDLDLMDWLIGIALPLTCYVLLAGTGAAFIARLSFAFSTLALVTIAALMNGVHGAWELLVWMAVVRSRPK